MKFWTLILVPVLAWCAAGASAATEQAITLQTPTGAIEGTLRLPDTVGRVPVVLIIAGSGPTDRDGNAPGLPGKNNSLLMLAQALADGGFASVRFDKRGVAASALAGPREEDLRLDTYVDDARAWADRLATDARFSGLAVLGHSEGGLIAMLAARGGPARAVLLLASPAQPASELLRQQLKGRLPPDLAAVNEALLQSLEAGRLVAQVPQALHVLYRPSVQPYLVSWFRRVPAQALAALTVPALIVQGDTDRQVGVDQAHALQAARPQATLVVVPGMNHLLKAVPLDDAAQRASFTDASLPLAPGLAHALTSFLASVFRPDGPAPPATAAR